MGQVDETHFSELNRRITQRELDKLEAYLFDLGLDGFVQERSAAKEQYIPDFRLEGL